MRTQTLEEQQRLHLLANAVIFRHYRRPLTLLAVSKALSCSPRQLQRVFRRFGDTTFSEQLSAVRLSVAAQLLAEQRGIPVADVAALVGYSHGAHLAKAFKRRYGMSPKRFRELARQRALARMRVRPPAQRREARASSACLPPLGR